MAKKTNKYNAPEGRNTYMMVFSPEIGDAQSVSKVLDVQPIITDWRYDMENCIYFKTSMEVSPCVDFMRKLFPKGRFLVVDMARGNAHMSGYLIPDTWRFLGYEVQQPVTNR